MFMPATLDVGSGDALLFANSAVTDYTMFQPQFHALRDQYRIIAHNTRSLTDNWHGPYTLWDLADEWRTLLDERDIEKAVVVGSSMGGYMGLRFALRYPDRITGLVLIGSTAVPNTPDETVAFRSKFEELRGAGTIPRKWAEWVSTVVFSEHARRDQPKLVKGWISRWTSLYPADAIIEEAHCWLDREDLTPRLRELRVPTLVVHGEMDAAIPLARSAPLAHQIIAAEMLVVPQAGHLVNLEKPSIVNEALGSFLHRVHR